MQAKTMFRAASAMMLAAVLAACSSGGDSSTAPKDPDAISGEFVLQTVGGDPLPVTLFQDPGGKLEIIAGHTTFHMDKSWTASMTFRVSGPGQPTYTQETGAAGTYTINGSAITMRDNADGSEGTGTLNGNTISTVFDFGGGLTYAAVFRK
jgi:hypothetical protein